MSVGTYLTPDSPHWRGLADEHDLSQCVCPECIDVRQTMQPLQWLMPSYNASLRTWWYAADPTTRLARLRRVASIALLSQSSEDEPPWEVASGTRPIDVLTLLEHEP